MKLRLLLSWKQTLWTLIRLLRNIISCILKGEITQTYLSFYFVDILSTFSGQKILAGQVLTLSLKETPFNSFANYEPWLFCRMWWACTWSISYSTNTMWYNTGETRWHHHPALYWLLWVWKWWIQESDVVSVKYWWKNWLETGLRNERKIPGAIFWTVSYNKIHVHRCSYMSAHVLLNLLNELGGGHKMWGLQSILSLFLNEFNKFNNTRARMLHSFYHMPLRLLWNLISAIKMLQFCHYYGPHNFPKNL